MNEALAFQKLSVADLLRDHPQTSRFFLSKKTGCVGCHLARFCTLNDVVRIYEFDEDEFYAELDKAIKIPPLTRSSK
jgi:hybrid cluster-associated redox disulfide protein